MSTLEHFITKALLGSVLLSGATFAALPAASAFADERQPEPLEIALPTDATPADYPTASGTPESIIGTDDRIHVPNTTIQPFSSVVRTELQQTAGSLSLGSGTVIGKNLILTAGHVAAKYKKQYDWNHVYPGRDGNYYPFGEFRVKEAYWLQTYDIGVLIVAPNKQGKSIGEVVPIMPINQNAKVGDPIMVPGYSGDKSAQQWYSTGTILSQDSRFWNYDADTKGGNSGGPVYNQNNEIIGVHVVGGTEANGGTKLQGEPWNFVKKHLDAETQANQPSVSPSATPKPTATPTPNPSATPSAKPTPTVKPTPTPTPKPSASPTAQPSSTPTTSPTPSGDTWSPSQTYVAGDTVIYKGKPYKAKWWTKNNAPDTSAAWEQIAPKNSDGSVDYIPGKAYTGGTIVKYNGKSYKAKWWTTSTPGSDNTWTAV